jgi:YHS domain-containing protein
MKKHMTYKLTCAAALCSLAAVLFCTGAFTAERSPAPCKNDDSSALVAKQYGFFQTRWREWPGESRPDKNFPASVGREAIPTPQAQEIIPAPEAKPPATEKEGSPSILPNINPPTGGVLPPLDIFRSQEPAPKLPSLGPGALEEPPDIFQNVPPLQKPRAGILPGLPTPARPDAPKENDIGATKRPQSNLKADAIDAGYTAEPKDSVIQADWSSALEPGRRAALDGQRFVGGKSQSTGQVVRQPAAEPQDRARARNPISEGSQQSRQPAQGVSYQENIPVAFGGYCPVELCKNERWVKGDAQWTEMYQGTSYVFSSAAQRECFLIDPERYVPAYGGRDPVLLIDTNQTARGKLEHCVTYNGRLYMFAGADSLMQFHKEPDRYAVQAR